jgi:hypothetical protein
MSLLFLQNQEVELVFLERIILMTPSPTKSFSE